MGVPVLNCLGHLVSQALFESRVYFASSSERPESTRRARFTSPTSPSQNVEDGLTDQIRLGVGDIVIPAIDRDCV